MIIALHFLDFKKKAILKLYCFIAFSDLSPYGKCFVSPKYIKLSFGSFFLREYAIVSPPIPESNIPIGLLHIY